MEDGKLEDLYHSRMTEGCPVLPTDVLGSSLGVPSDTGPIHQEKKEEEKKGRDAQNTIPWP